MLRAPGSLFFFFLRGEDGWRWRARACRGSFTHTLPSPHLPHAHLPRCTGDSNAPCGSHARTCAHCMRTGTRTAETHTTHTQIFGRQTTGHGWKNCFLPETDVDAEVHTWSFFLHLTSKQMNKEPEQKFSLTIHFTHPPPPQNVSLKTVTHTHTHTLYTHAHTDSWLFSEHLVFVTCPPLVRLPYNVATRRLPFWKKKKKIKR